MSFAGNVTSVPHKFSILNTLESLRNPDGTLRLVLYYPPVSGLTTDTGNPIPGANGWFYNDWFQTNNPATGTPGLTTGFVPLALGYPSHCGTTCSTQAFVGLRPTAVNGHVSFMQGSPDFGWNIFEVGQLHGSHLGWGLQSPGYGSISSSSVTWQQLWAITGTAVTACPAGTYNPLNGSVGASACLACVTGFYSSGGASACIACPAGSFCLTPSIIRSCLPGMYSPQGATACISCPPGMFSSAPGSSACSVCSTGYDCI